MNAPKSTKAAGQDVLKDTLELLDGLEFDAVNGGTARTERLFVSIIPDWEDDTRQTFRANLTCQAMWHRKVDWQLMRVSVRPQRPSGFFVQHVLPLYADGNATFDGLDAGTYVLKAYCHLAQFTTPQPGEVEHDRDSSTELAQGVAMDGESSPGSSPVFQLKFKSLIHDMYMYIGSRGTSTTLEFVTNKDEYAGKSLVFKIVNPITKEDYFPDPQMAVFSSSPADGEYRFRTGMIELGFSPREGLAVSYRIL